MTTTAAHGFFASLASIEDLPRVYGSYSLGLVLLSIFMAIFMAMMAMHTSHIARFAPSMFLRRVSLATGSAALAIGIWITHFVGMLAFSLPAPVDYDASITILSLVPALIASVVALNILAKPRLQIIRLLFSGCLTGICISTMHYVGMAAMISPLQISYNPWLLTLSVFSAMFLSCLALLARFKTGFRVSQKQSFYLSSALLGSAIGAMNYIGMHAANYYGESSQASIGLVISHNNIALALSTLCITVGGMVLALNSQMRTHSFNQSMKANQSRLQAILDTAVDAIITIDKNGLIQDFNKGAQNLLGYDPFEVVGRNVTMLMPEPYHSKHDGYLENFHRTGETKIIGVGREVFAKHKDGSTLPVRLAVGQVKTDIEQEQLFVGLLSDISERRKLEESLRQTAHKAEQAANAKSNFLANMSHEIRTPMNAILGFTELLLQSELKPEQRSHLQTIQSSGNSLLRLINNILDTTKIEQGHLVLEQDNFSLRQLVQQLHSTLKLSAHNKGLYLELDYADDLADVYYGDAMRISQVLTNLVGNAIKFTETGGVTLSVQPQDNEHVLFQVTDTGIGMSQEQLQNIFDPFTQADASISRRFGGTGLGTTIARQLVESMQGEITLQSTLGVGTSFAVSLPLAKSEALAQVESTEAELSLSSMHILIADDVPQNLELLRLILERQGHSVVSTNDGQQAVELVANNSFDLVLMDLHMPQTDGLQATAQIRLREQQLGLVRTPIIALTASVMRHERDAAEVAGMDGFATKPINLQQLNQEIARVLSHQSKTCSQHRQSSKCASDNPVIDWQTALTLWGDKQQLLQQIDKFIHSCNDKYPLQLDMEQQQLIFNLHGMRGASANLGLSQLSQLLATIEQQLQQNPQQQISEQQLTQVQQCINAVLQLVACNIQPTNSEQQAPRQQLDSMQLQELIQDLLNQLERGQFAENQLELLCSALDPADAKRLRAYIDDFDFTRACSLLKQRQTTD